ncbi:cytosolic 5'-nucleotidase 1A [Pungitius pungitius]|uniref:cytosolic 5'-nucleotidase 1A n=1 Tax=Pungitius pungitius TaxID=134920 RepID=UPI002E14A7C6
MVSTVHNTDVKQKDAGCALVVAVTARAVFDAGTGDVYGMGVAFPLLQSLQRVNERLLEKNPAEKLLFDVVLIATDSQQQSSRIISSTSHYGLEVGRFCFSSREDLVETLLVNKVHLFLSTDREEALQASHKGVPSALLGRQEAPSEPLRVMLCGDAVVRPDSDPAPASRRAAQSFSARLGEMRGRFGAAGSPLSIVLVTSSGGSESCGVALQALRSRGLAVDEAYCLAGAPRGPILSLLRPHFLLGDGVIDLED